MNNLLLSASYSAVEPNFLVQNIPDSTETLGHAECHCAMVALNLLQRGNTIIPTEFLLKQLGIDRDRLKAAQEVIGTPFLKTPFEAAHNWNATILVDPENNRHAAYAFYEKWLPHILGAEFSWIKAHLRPEVPHQEILYSGGMAGSKSDNRADFYIEPMKLVIEVDADAKDLKAARSTVENVLNPFGVQVLRIKASSLLDHDLENTPTEIEKVKAYFHETPIVKKWVTDVNLNETYADIHVPLCAAIRIQFVIAPIIGRKTQA